MKWPEWLFVQAPALPFGLLLLAICAILATWGLSLLRSAWPARRFEFWLGVFMVLDASLYLLLGINILESPDGIDLWVAVLFALIALPAVLAFWAWARDRMPS